jgi:hypothetical protein
MFTDQHYSLSESALNHTDLERGFIRANVNSIPDLQEPKTEVGLKSAS